MFPWVCHSQLFGDLAQVLDLRHDLLACSTCCFKQHVVVVEFSKHRNSLQINACLVIDSGGRKYENFEGLSVLLVLV